MSVRQYIGARYVTKIYENSQDPSSAEWEASVNYEPLTMVTYNNGSYLSKKTVPASVGNPASNPTYWVQTGFYNGQIAQLQDEIDDINTDITSIQGEIANISTGRVSRAVVISDSYGLVRGGNTPWTTTLQTYLGLSNANYFTFSEGSMGFNRAGDNGHTTQQLMVAHEDDITDHNTISHVIIGMGLNDSLAISGLDTAIANCISYIKSEYPAAKILIGYIGNFYTKNTSTYNNYIASLNAYINACGAGNCGYITGVENVMHNNTFFQSDGTHPTTAGCNAIANYVTAYINGGSSYSVSGSCAVTSSYFGASSAIKMTIKDDLTEITPALDNSSATLNLTRNNATKVGSITDGYIAGIGGYTHYGQCHIYDGTNYKEALWYIYAGDIYLMPFDTFTMPSGAVVWFNTLSCPTINI